jgi:phosphonoacetate hydrolase
MRRLGLWIGALAVCPAVWGQAARHAVLIDLDGVGRDTFVQAYQQGRLPNFGRVLATAFWFDNATTVVPSVTMATQASIVTGTPPVRHGMVGNQWFDRESGRLVDYMDAYGITCVYGFAILGGQDCTTGLGNRHLQMPTMYEAAAAAGLTSVVVYNQYWKGASRPAAPSMNEGSAILKNTAQAYRMFDNLMANRAAADIQAHGLPSILTLYFAGADGFAHKLGIASQAPYMAETIDPLLGMVLDAIERQDPGWRSSTLVVVTADHGRTDVKPNAEDAGLETNLRATLPRGAHLAMNGGIGYVYLPDRNRDALAAVAAAIRHDAIASVRVRTGDDPERAGDLIITLKQGHYFNNSSNGSQHGGVYPEDMAIPLVVAVPGMAGGQITEPVRNTQIARTIADFLGFAMETADPPLPVLKPDKRAVRQ